MVQEEILILPDLSPAAYHAYKILEVLKAIEKYFWLLHVEFSSPCRGHGHETGPLRAERFPRKKNEKEQHTHSLATARPLPRLLRRSLIINRPCVTQTNHESMMSADIV